MNFLKSLSTHSFVRLLPVIKGVALRKSNRAVTIVLMLCVMPAFSTLAQQKTVVPYTLALTTKVHSAGHSPYSGVYKNYHPNLEMNLLYKCKKAGGFISKNTDFVDVHSTINFATVGVFRSFNVNKALKITPYIGYYFSQSHSFADKGSNMWTSVVTRMVINKILIVENTMLFGNVLRREGSTSLANRLNIAVIVRKFRVDFYTWYTHSLTNAPHYVSASMAITSPEWIVSPTLSLKLQAVMMQQVTTERPSEAMNRGGLISIIALTDWSRK